MAFIFFFLLIISGIQCQIFFPDSHLMGGVRQFPVGSFTLQSCLSQCRGLFPECLSCDYDDFGDCYFHPGPFEIDDGCNSRLPSPISIHMRVQPCPRNRTVVSTTSTGSTESTTMNAPNTRTSMSTAPDSSEDDGTTTIPPISPLIAEQMVFPQMGMAGGSKRLPYGSYSLDSCVALCKSEPGCEAVDFDMMNDCYTHPSPYQPVAVCNRMAQNTRCTHYRVRPCSTYAGMETTTMITDSTTNVPNTRRPRTTAASTSSPMSGTMTPSTMTPSTIVPSTTMPSATMSSTVMPSIMVRSITMRSMTMSPTMMQSTTTGPPAPLDQLCQIPNHYITGTGELLPNMTSETDCYQFCKSNSACIAVDFNIPFKQCYPHYGGVGGCEFLKGAPANSQIIHARKGCCAVVPPTMGP